MTSYSPKILITGADGQLGSALKAHPLARDFHITACTKEMLNVSEMASIEHAIKQYSPDFIVNAAAYTAVDKAENEVDKCMHINLWGAKNISIACKHHDIPMLQISTDYVFDGIKTMPYRETDTANPINIYGKSKWLGEQAVREQSDKHIILRLSGIFSEFGLNFMKTILRLAKEKTELHIIEDQMTCPTNANQIAGVIYTMLKQTPNWGTFHYCDVPSITWYEFALSIIVEARKMRLPLTVEKITPIPSFAYPAPAKRPKYSVLDCSKIKASHNIAQAEWNATLAETIKRIENRK